MVQNYFVYVGTFTNLKDGGHRSEGIYIFRLNGTESKLYPVGAVRGLLSPSFLALHPTGRYLYAVNEVKQFEGKIGGAISAFAIDRKTGGLTPLNRQFSRGADPCYVSVDKEGRWLLASNYSGGNAIVYPILPDGSLGKETAFVQHQGSGPNAVRQEAAHAHSIQMDPTNRFVLIADLGLDQVVVYRLDLQKGTLAPNNPPGAKLPPGSGPRHLVFHPNQSWMYVANELNSTVSVFACDLINGRFDLLQTLSTLPEGFSEENTVADIHLAHGGRWLFVSNRGHDSLASFAVDNLSGRLTALGHTPTGGQTPRNFNLDPSNNLLLAANQDSDSIVTFRLDAATGTLTRTGEVTAVPRPVCVVFLPAE